MREDLAGIARITSHIPLWIIRGRWGIENGLHRRLDVSFQ
jgi:hypothetical protein